MKTFKEFQEQIAPTKALGSNIRDVDTVIDTRTLSDKEKSVKNYAKMIKYNPKLEKLFKVP